MVGSESGDEAKKSNMIELADSVSRSGNITFFFFLHFWSVLSFDCDYSQFSHPSGMFHRVGWDVSPPLTRN